MCDPYAKRMGDRKIKKLWPAWVQNVAKIRAAKTPLYAWCPECDTMQIVTDSRLRAIEAVHGPFFSFIDRHPQCTVMIGAKRCRGRVVFRYCMGEHLPSVPLVSEPRPHTKIRSDY